MNDGSLGPEAGDTAETLTHLTPYQPQTGEADLRGFEWHFLRAGLQADIQTLRGHIAPILTAHVSPDDKYIASGDRGGVVRVCELATGRDVKSLHYDQQEVTCVRFAPDGQTLATAGMDRTIRLWKVSDWSEVACLRGHDLTVTRPSPGHPTASNWHPVGAITSSRSGMLSVTARCDR